jgi:hypothetical protein
LICRNKRKDVVAIVGQIPVNGQKIKSLLTINEGLEKQIKARVKEIKNLEKLNDTLNARIENRNTYIVKNEENYQK